jgi:catechol 2,3-dioxygenase-like lactoylglutathione lyase family enzyme
MLKQAIPVLHVSNAAVAAEFYCRRLGFRVEFNASADGTGRDPCYLGLVRDGAVIHISSHAGDGVAGGVAYLRVEDVDALYAELRQKDVRIHGPTDQTWGMRELYVRDPDGNSIRFGNPVAG